MISDQTLAVEMAQMNGFLCGLFVSYCAWILRMLWQARRGRKIER